MDIEDLEAVLVPPGHPVETGCQEGWVQVEQALGVALPLGYRRFVDIYGTGAINEFLLILNPFAEDPLSNLLKRGEVIRKDYITVRTEFPEYAPFRVFPEAGGILPWAVDDNGDNFYWLTEGDPDHWPIIVYDSRAPEYYAYHQAWTDFLVSLLTRMLHCPIIPDVFLSDPPTFCKLSESGQ